ncbi:MAG: DUF433 domain-containing protein [Bryobacter sp.]
MEWRESIVLDPKVLSGKPIVKGTRISVELVIGLLAEGWSEQQILENYPTLKSSGIRSCLSYASELPHEKKVYPLELA